MKDTRTAGRTRTGGLIGLAGAIALIAALALTVAIRPALAAPTELLISEYVEGSGNNKALEIFNGTGGAVTLTGHYDVQVFANGSPTATATIPLTGTVADGDVFVLARSTAVAAILAEADQTTTNFLWNGNDAVVLRRDGVAVDVIGQLGADPGVEWGSGEASTADNTLRRKASVQAGDANGGDAFDPAAAWDGLPLDTFNGLGAHALAPGGGSGGGSGGAPPVAVDDVAQVEEDGGTLEIDVLANDSDSEGDPLAVVAVTDPAHGTAVVAPDGARVWYVPEVDFSGSDSFSYTLSDGNATATATVQVSVEPANDDPEPEDDVATTAEDTAVEIDVLGNDEDPDGDQLTLVSVEDGEHGRVYLAQDGTAVGYEPEADWNGVDSFEVVVGDGQGLEAAEVVVTVAAVDDPPRPADDAVTIAQGASTFVDVLANDVPGPADEASQQLTVVSVSPAGHGVAELVTSGADAGRVRYIPNPAFTGSDSFTYVVSDGAHETAASVSVLVRPASLRSLCALPPTIVGTPRSDVIVGTPGDDVIRGRRGNDVIDGNGGNDIVCAGPGADTVTTGPGRDRVVGGTGADTVATGGGSDVLRGGAGGDRLEGGPGDDSIAAGAGRDSVDAGDGANAVAGGTGDDDLRSGPGDDRLDGGPGHDACEAGGGRNTVLRCE